MDLTNQDVDLSDFLVVEDESIKRMLAEEAFSEQYRKSRSKFSLQQDCIITDSGRKIVEQDPNLMPSTIKRLVASESVFITQELRERILNEGTNGIAYSEFVDNTEVGAMHLALIIKGKLEQSKAELIDTYAEERQIPFIEGLIYINSFMEAKFSTYPCADSFQKNSPLFYTVRSGAGTERVGWQPTIIDVTFSRNHPPKKKPQFKKIYNDTKAIERERLNNCAICGNPAKMIKAGNRNRYYMVCCTDPTMKCKNFLRFDLWVTPQDAAREWNTQNNCVKQQGQTNDLMGGIL